MTSSNLSDLFGPSAAASTAASTLANKLPRRASEESAPPQSVKQQSRHDSSDSARQVNEGHHQLVDDVNEVDDLAAQVSVYVLPAVVTTVRRIRNGRTNAQIAFEAITTQRDQLPTLLAAHRSPAPQPTTGVGPFAPQPGDRGGSAPRRVLWTFKATGRNQRVLDRIVAEAGAASRSELVAAALEAHLLRGAR